MTSSLTKSRLLVKALFARPYRSIETASLLGWQRSISELVLFIMGEESTATSDIPNTRKAATASGNASRSATPTNTEGVSKKRPRSETLADNNTTTKKNEGDNDENDGSGVKKKKKEQPLPTSSTLTFEEEIAMASSETTVQLLKSSLQRLTDGIPKRELKLIVQEAKACEAALEEELRVLRQGLELEKQKKTTTSNPSEKDKKSSDSSASSLTEKETEVLQTILESEFTPTDAHWTLSALLGRLRHELTTPLPPRSQLPVHREKQGLTQLARNVGLASQSIYKKRGPRPASATPTTNTATSSSGETDEATKATTTEPLKTPNEASEDSQFKRLESLPDHIEYHRNHATPDKLLAVWKKLSTHRSSLVFRRPVNPKEAPGYTERIRFPMDLSLIRKLVLSKHIKTYEGILKQVHLIGHNCVKYNGRESDYALVTREFESVATEYVWNAVMRETYGGTRGRWSRNVSPIPPSGSSSNLAATEAVPTPAAKPAESTETTSPPAASDTTDEKPTKS